MHMYMYIVMSAGMEFQLNNLHEIVTITSFKLNVCCLKDINVPSTCTYYIYQHVTKDTMT